jgi:chromosome partitioning protein
MQDFQATYPQHPLQLAGVAFNAATEYAPEEQLAKADVRRIAAQHQWFVFNAEVPYSRSFPKGAREGMSIYGTSYSRRTTRRRFAAFALEFAQRIAL